ncbi:MAG: hypothetical protein GY796_12500 [Chloroflexi bacterium]|nr:hypothetical protein [Chloroflexota bacterium]
MWLLFLIFCSLVAGAVFVAVLAYKAPRLVSVTAVIVAFISILIWFILRSQLPLTAELSPLLIWQIDETGWVVSLWLLLLLSGNLLAGFKMSAVEEPASFPQLLSPSFLLGLTAVTLVIVWANSLPGMMMGWSALLLLWSGVVWGGTRRVERSGLVRKLSLLWLGVLLMWLAVIWTDVTEAALIMAVLLQLGIWTLGGWRPGLGKMEPSVAALVYLLPVTAGGVLLLHLLGVPAGMRSNTLLLLTLLGLLGILLSLRLAWERLHVPLRTAAALTVVAVHLVLLAGVWAGQAAALAELRVVLLAGGILFLAANRPISRIFWWRAVAPVVALAALVGVPLTAGFAGLSALYEGLVADGRILLLLALLFLQMPLLTAGLLLCRPRGEGEGGTAVSRTDLIQDAGMLLLALGLFSLNGMAAADWWAWLLPLLIMVGGSVIYRFVGEFRKTTAAVRQAFHLELPIGRITRGLQLWWQGIQEAFGEAAAILEGDGNLLWLFAIVIIFLLVR